MCGILGVVGKLPSEKVLIDSRDSLAHRGPDDAGLFYDPQNGVALGQRRLSIIDLTVSGHQPFLSADGRYVLIFNGEIYNYLELKGELNDQYNFQTKTDTEVLLASYIIWGKKCLEKLNGMFAFAIWDKLEKKLFCARDRLGIKPFFFLVDGGTVAFSSEIKALLKLKIKTPSANESIIFDYLFHGMYDHTEDTFFAGIKNLRPGHYFSWQNGNIGFCQYWDLADVKMTEPGNLEEAKEKFEYLLSDSIRLQFRSDVPVGVNLSSGLDSNGLLYFTKKITGKDVHSFSMCLSDNEYDECQIIDTYLEPNKKKFWHKANLDPKNVFSLAEDLNVIQDQPYGGIPTIAYAMLNDEASKAGITVLLEGQGMDELLAGYEYYKMDNIDDRAKNGGINLGKSSVSFGQDMTKLTYHEILNKEFISKYSDRFLTFKNSFPSKLMSAQYRDLFYSKLPRVLRFNDHVSMAYGRELRVPFLDHRLVEFCFWLPSQYKIGADGTQKLLMREVMKKYIPQVVANKSKKAFTAVQTKWFRLYFAGIIKEYINSQSFVDRGYWNNDELVKKIDGFMRGEGNNSFFIWQCINLEMWFRKFID